MPPPLQRKHAAAALSQAGRAEPGRAGPGPMSQYAPSQPAGRPHRPDVRDRRRQTDIRRQTDVRRASLLNAPAYGQGHNNNNNNNNRISIASYGRNFIGAGGRSDQCSVKA